MGSDALTGKLWVTVCTMLVVFMQVGFCALESGAVRRKNGINVAAKNALDFCVATLMYWLCGYGLMFGESLWGVVGFGPFAPNDLPTSRERFELLFQLAFCCTTVTIISGSVAERMRLSSYLWLSTTLAGLLYPTVGHWVWNRNGPNGWLAQLGFTDFAGAGVVHLLGGMAALACVIKVGARKGRFDGHQDWSGHDMTRSALGTLILLVGWLGFNGGSLMTFDDRVATIIINTLLGAAAGSLAAGATSVWVHSQLRIPAMLNGCLGGLVSITGCCNLVPPSSAVFIAAVGGVLTVLAHLALERVRIDDAISAFPVHGVCGAWSLLSVALFGKASELPLQLSIVQQLGVQMLGIAAIATTTFAFTYAMAHLINRYTPLRVSPKAERLGLNEAEHGLRSPIASLVQQMAEHHKNGDFRSPVIVEPYTDAEIVAEQYNRVLQKMVDAQVASEQRAEQLEIAHERATSLRKQAERARAQAVATAREQREFLELAAGREFRLGDLKLEVNELKQRLGLSPSYPLSAEGSGTAASNED